MDCESSCGFTKLEDNFKTISTFHANLKREVKPFVITEAMKEALEMARLRESEPSRFQRNYRASVDVSDFNRKAGNLRL